MKKFVIVMLVLGMATTANAVLTLSVDGGPNPGNLTLAMSETIELDVTAPIGLTGGSFTIQLSNSQGALGYSTLEYSTEYCDLYIPSIPYSTYTTWDMPWAPKGSDPMDSKHITVNGGNFSNAIALPDTIVWGIIFHCEEHTPVTISLISDGVDYAGGEVLGGVVMDSIVVQQIPEPATIALLGLGGLLLRRRK